MPISRFRGANHIGRLSGLIALLAVLPFPSFAAAFNALLQGQSRGSAVWVDGNLEGWRELDYIPCRVYLKGGPTTAQKITVEFDRMQSRIPAIQNLTGFTPSANVVITSQPVLSAPSDSPRWTYTFTVNLLDGQPGWVEFRARLAAGSHLNVGSSVGLRGSPSLGSLQIHKPSAGPGYPDLQLVKTGASQAAPGEVIHYTLRYANNSSALHTAVGAQITDLLPSQVTLLTNSVMGGEIVGNCIFWDLGNVTSGASGSVSYSVRVNPTVLYGQTFTNWALVLSSEDDENLDDNDSSVLTRVVFNRAPSAQNDAYSTSEDTQLTIAAPGILANDSDADGDTLTALIVTPPTNGAVTLNANGSFTYRPATNFHGTDGFTYRAVDATTNSSPASVTILVSPGNDAPAAVNDRYTVSEDSDLLVTAPGVLANDSDLDGDMLTALLVSGPAHGTLSLNPNGSFTYRPNSNYHGDDTFTYKARDGSAESGTATVSITILPANDPPIARNDTYSTTEDTIVTINAPGILANDTDAEGDALSAVLLTGPTHGTLSLNANGGFIYRPNTNYHGEDSFTYKAHDGTADSASATVSIAVIPVNDPPIALNDSYATVEDTLLVIATPGILANDTDADGDTLTAVIVTQPTNGVLTLNASGSFSYQPGTNFHGADGFTYRAADAITNSSVASATITVTPRNDLPIAANDRYSVAEDSDLIVPIPGILANDTDVDGDVLSAVLLSGPTHGSLSLNANGGFTYRPNTNYHGQDSFTYKAHDGTADSAPATVSITVIPVNDPPVAANDSYATAEDTQLTIAVPGILANDSDADGDTLTAVIVTQPTNGVLTLNANGSFSYQPATNFHGTDGFTYRGADAITNSSVASVTITVTPRNDLPAATNDQYSVAEDSELIVPTPGILANDADIDGDALSAVLLSGPTHGTLSLNANGGFTYRPNTNYHGQDSFTYKAHDGTADSAPATVSITVIPVNDPPLAVNDSYTTDEDQILTISPPGILANDGDPDGDGLNAVLLSQPTSGMLTLNANGSFTYRPNTNFHGSDSFTYLANDGTSTSSVASVTLVVRPINDMPQAVDDRYTVSEDSELLLAAPGVLHNDSDADGDALTAVLVTAPAYGTLALNANGGFSYKPYTNYHGEDFFTYVARGNNADSGIATVLITVSPVNDPPVAANDSYATAEDTQLTIAVPGILANDSDADGDTLTAVIVTQPTNGVLTLNANGSFSYQPATNFHGTDGFTYRATDATATSAVASVTLLVNPGNDAPLAANDQYTVSEDLELIVPTPGILANDTDVDGDVLSAVLLTGPSHGTLSLNANGGFTYRPNTNYHGQDTFTYKAHDGTADSAPATVSITVTPVNDPPVAANDSYVTAEDTLLTIAAPGILTNDSDADGDTLTAVIVTPPTNGVLTLNANGSFSYQPSTNFHGADGFTYRADDALTNSSVATVTITVNPRNDLPAAANDQYTVSEDLELIIPTPGILANDADIDGDVLSAVLLSGPTHGTLSLNASGGFTYRPNTNYHGPDAFTYKAHDGTADSAPATVSITVIPVNDPPVAANDSYATAEDTQLTIAAPGILANDSDADGDTLTAVIVTPPTNGVLTLNANGSFSYQPATNFHGVDGFTYRATDATATSAVAAVTITVTPRNDLPIAANDQYSVAEDAVLMITTPGILANDSDVDGDALSAVLLSGPTHGTLSLNANGGFTYRPNTNYHGQDAFTYKAHDGTADSPPATVSITVIPVNDPPVAANDSYATTEDTLLTIAVPGILANDSDADGDSLQVSLLSGPAHGTLTLNSNGAFTYQPNADFNGVDSFVYRASDAVAASTDALVEITVQPANDPPVAAPDTVIAIEDTPLAIVITSLLANDQDTEGTPLSINVAIAPANGTLSGAPADLTYSPSPNYHGQDVFSYTASDGSATSAPATVSIQVLPVNDAPSFTIASDVRAQQGAGEQTLTGWARNILAGPANEQDQTLQFVVTVDKPELFAIQPAISPAGTLTFRATQPAQGLVRATVLLRDSGGTERGGIDTSAAQEFTITIVPNNPPIVSIVHPTNGAVYIAKMPLTVLADASDTDGTIASVELFEDADLLRNTTQAPYFHTITSLLSGTLHFTATATDDLGARATSAAVNIQVLEYPPHAAGPFVLNRQTGLFEQRVVVTNPTPESFAGIRLHIDRVRHGVTVWNATGSSNNIPYIEARTQIPAGGSIEILVEYHAPDMRVPPNPVFTPELLFPLGGVIHETEAPVITRGYNADGRFVIEFNARSTGVYCLQHSSDLVQWNTVPLPATGGTVRWVDVTSNVASHRFYRLIYLP